MSAGPLRYQYIHRIVAAAMIGRALTKDEEVDHRDRNKLNPWFTNLIIRGEKDHGWVSAKQAHFMRHKDAQEEAEWEAFMARQDQKQAEEIAAARCEGKPWYGEDGRLAKAWEEEHSNA
jgi:hypothetical protein